jgi:hypothetical protein
MTASGLDLAVDSKLKVVDLQKDPYALARWVLALSLDARSVLMAARCYGMQWSTYFTREAAYHKQLPLLQWLYKCDCPIDFRIVIKYAVYRNQVDILACVRSIKTCIWDDYLLNRNLMIAGRAGSVAAAAWLRSIGTKWPASFVASDFFGKVNVCWQLCAVQWALANGCTWGDWQCQDFAPHRLQHEAHESSNRFERSVGQSAAANREHAAELFTWAHQNGCPCTCAMPQQLLLLQ